MKNIISTLLLIASSVACTHLAISNSQDFKAFPTRFFTEQMLTITTPQETKRVKAQLQKRDEQEGYDLVLVDPLFNIVLAKAFIDKQSVRIIHAAPRLNKDGLPIDEIGTAIRSLYEAKNFQRDGLDYIWRAKNGAYVYRLKSIQGSAGCLYPEHIYLRFEDQHYDLAIQTESFTCTLE